MKMTYFDLEKEIQLLGFENGEDLENYLSSIGFEYDAIYTYKKINNKKEIEKIVKFNLAHFIYYNVDLSVKEILVIKMRSILGDNAIFMFKQNKEELMRVLKLKVFI